MTQLPLVSIVIPTYNRKAKIQRLIHSIWANNYPRNRIEIFVVDNGSTDGTREALARDHTIKLILSAKNLYSAGGRNEGARHTAGEYIFFIDDDNVLDELCIGQLVEHFESSEALGIVGPLMLDYNHPENIWCAGGVLDAYGRPHHLYINKHMVNIDKQQAIPNIDYFPNAYMVRAEVMQRIQHDTELFPHNWAEQDFCLRAKALGYTLETKIDAVTYHDFGKLSRITRVGIDKSYDQARGRMLFRRKYYNTFNNWLFFWVILFPASTIFYGIVFIKDENNAFKLFESYIRGSLSGLKQKI